jgi:hypothetical protein
MSKTDDKWALTVQKPALYDSPNLIGAALHDSWIGIIDQAPLAVSLQGVDEKWKPEWADRH